MKLKLIVTFLSIYFFSISIYSQDIILKKDGSEISSQIVEINQHTIKYKLFGDPNGPIRNISKSEVFKITYQNGQTEVFSISNSPSLPNLETKVIEKKLPKKQTAISTGIDLIFEIDEIRLDASRFKVKLDKMIGAHLAIYVSLGYRKGITQSYFSSEKLTSNSITLPVGLKLFFNNRENIAENFFLELGGAFTLTDFRVDRGSGSFSLRKESAFDGNLNIGYRFQLEKNNLFIEPSIGLFYSGNHDQGDGPTLSLSFGKNF